MGVRKVSVSLDEKAAAVAQRAADAEGISLSAWLSRAALREAKIEEGLRAADEAIAEIEAARGRPFSEQEWRETDEILDRLLSAEGP